MKFECKTTLTPNQVNSTPADVALAGKKIAWKSIFESENKEENGTNGISNPSSASAQANIGSGYARTFSPCKPVSNRLIFHSTRNGARP